MTTVRQRTTQPVKSFRVVSVSKNANSFGLHGHILMSRDGEAWQVGRHIGSWLEPWDTGTTLRIKVDDDGIPLWALHSCEIPQRLPNAPSNVIREVWPD